MIYRSLGEHSIQLAHDNHSEATGEAMMKEVPPTKMRDGYGNVILTSIDTRERAKVHGDSSDRLRLKSHDHPATGKYPMNTQRQAKVS